MDGIVEALEPYLETLEPYLQKALGQIQKNHQEILLREYGLELDSSAPRSGPPGFYGSSDLKSAREAFRCELVEILTRREPDAAPEERKAISLCLAFLRGEPVR